MPKRLERVSLKLKSYLDEFKQINLKVDTEFMIFLFIILLSFFLRMLHLGQESLWVDEILQAGATNSTRSLSDVVNIAAQHAQCPLDYLLLHFNQLIFGNSSDALIRLNPALFGVLSSILLYFFLRRISLSRIGLLASFLLAINVYAINYSQEIRPYSLVVIIQIINFFAFYYFLTEPSKKSLSLYGASILIALYSHLFFSIIIFIEVIFILVCAVIPKIRKSITMNKKYLIYLVGIVFFSTLLYLPIFIKIYRIALSRYVSVTDPLLIRTIKAFSMLSFRHYFTIHRNIISTLKIFGNKIPYILLIFGIWNLFRKKRILFFSISSIILFFPILYLLYFHINRKGNYLFFKYYIHLLPIYMIIFASGIDYIIENLGKITKTGDIKHLLVCIFILLSLFLSQSNFNQYYLNSRKQDIRGFVRFVYDFPHKVDLQSDPVWLKMYITPYYNFKYRDRSTKYYIDDKVVKLWLTYHTRDSYRADDTDLILFREFQGLKLWALPDKDFIKR